VSKSDPSWSYKENSPAQRYMVFTDLGHKARYVNGPYSPKTDDNGWCQIKRDHLPLIFNNANIVGDGHFRWGQYHIDNPKIIAPWTLPNGDEDESDDNASDDDGDGNDMDIDDVPNKLTKEKKSENKRIRRVRAAVESPFGLLKMHWYKLGHPWLGNLEEQEHLVRLALAILNYQRK